MSFERKNALFVAVIIQLFSQFMFYRVVFSAPESCVDFANCLSALRKVNH